MGIELEGTGTGGGTCSECPYWRYPDCPAAHPVAFAPTGPDQDECAPRTRWREAEAALEDERKLCQSYKEMAETCDECAEKAEAQVKRLREALRYIIRCQEISAGTMAECSSVIRIARQALKELEEL